jgi:hypothetical protein
MAPRSSNDRPQLPPFIVDTIRAFQQGLKVTNSPEWKAQEKRRLDDLERYVNHQMQINLTSWKHEVDGAINEAPYPAEQESRASWWIALAGNMLWAATCFIPVVGEGAAVAQAMIRLMSVAGAAFGSGLADQANPEGNNSAFRTPEDGKVFVRNTAGRRRGELEDFFKQQRSDWAKQLDGIRMWESVVSSQEPLDLYDKQIWTLMFPRVDYDENRFNAIRAKCRAKVTRLLNDYNLQWREYVRQQMMPRSHQAEALWIYGTLAIPRFQPKLTIDLRD